MLLLRTPRLPLIPGLMRILKLSAIHRSSVVVVPTAPLLLVRVDQLRVRNRHDHRAVIGHASPRHPDALLSVVRLPSTWHTAGIVAPVGIHHARVSGLVAGTVT